MRWASVKGVIGVFAPGQPLDELTATYPAQREMIYGEWLRNAFEGGETPEPTRDPENTLILTQTRQNAIPLFGPDAMELLPYVSPSAVRSAMREGIPALLDGVYGASGTFC